MCRNCETEEILMLSGVDMGSLCAEDEYFDVVEGRCAKIPYDPQPPAPEVPDPICEPGWINRGGACVCDGTVDESGACITSTPQLPPGFVAPGAVPVVITAWDLEAQPYALYTLQWGDTYVGLSATYLGDGARWKEIWNLNRSQHPDPDKIYVSQTINMPDEAREKMKRWLKGGKKGKPGELPDEPTLPEKARSAAPWIIAAAALAAGGYYLMS